MTSEQVRIALTANAVTRSTRTGFDFEDPCGKTLDEFTKGATLQCLRVAQQMQQPGFEKVLAAQIFPCYTIANWNKTKVIYDFGKDFLELLMDTDDLTIHREVLERLPFKNFYVPLYNSVDYCGMFVHIEFDTKTDDTFVGIVLVGPVQNEKENFAFLSLPAWIKEGQSHIKRGSMRGLSSAGITAAMIVAAMNDVPEAYIAKFLEVFYSGFTTNEAEHYAVMLRDDLIRNNTSKTGTQYAKYAFYRTANRLNQYYKTATGQRVAKRINDGDFPYNIYDATGRIVKPETKKAKKKA